MFLKFIQERFNIGGRRFLGNFAKGDSGSYLQVDNSVRGMDYPGVTHVIQVGAPVCVLRHVHRLSNGQAR